MVGEPDVEMLEDVGMLPFGFDMCGGIGGGGGPPLTGKGPPLIPGGW